MEKKKNKNFKKALSAAFPYTVPVLTGYMVLGITYGVLMRTKGYDALWAVLMSAIAYCGSMQYVAITLLTIAFNPVQAFLLSLMVNARHLFYGLSMLEKYKGLGKAKGLLIYTLFDETFSVSSSVSPPDGIDRKYFYLSISFLNYIYWVTATFIGSILGKFINFNTEGLSFVLTALFVVLFMEQMKKKENRISGAIGILGTLSGLFVFGADRMIIPSMIFILLILLAGRKKVCF
ncbi:MAG: branched-chain amino acid transporter AzlC [Lachnospiraceae bacterium]|nr:branched-chain amino acid transporter AzlC [Lachnospiraceae bacterium]